MLNLNESLNDNLSLEQRITRLEDIEAIKQLKYQYARYCDNQYDPVGISSLFVPDGHWIVTGIGGEATGHDEIKKHFNAASKDIVWVVHYIMSPEIELAADGNSATGRFYLNCLATIINKNDRSQKDAVVMVGNYVDHFVKVNEKWYFKEISGAITQASEWTEGWVSKPWII